MSTLIVDTESDGFKYEATRLHCIVSYDVHKVVYNISAGEGQEALIERGMEEGYPKVPYKLIPSLTKHIDILSHADKVVMHNGLGHDVPLIKRLYGVDLVNIEDTFIMSSLSRPDRVGPPNWVGKPKPHSIEAYAKRFNMSKIGHDDWSCFSWNMLDRCINDVMVGYKTWEYLKEEMRNWDWSKALMLEHSVARIQAQQEMNGVLFDKEGALALLSLIDKEVSEIDREVLSKLPKSVVQVGCTVSKPFKKDGTLRNFDIKGWQLNKTI